MPRKNFGDTVNTSSASPTNLLQATASETITIRTITAANRSNPGLDVLLYLGYRDSSANAGVGKNVFLGFGMLVRSNAPNGGSSSLSFDVGQVLEPNDYLFAYSDTANSLDVSGSYEV